MTTQYRIRFIADTDAESPREWCNLGHMVCWHRRYKLGDEQPSEQPVDWREAFEAEHPEHVLLPLYLYDHSGITMSTSAFTCPWDSGQVGFVYATREDAKRIGVEWNHENIEKLLRSEVETYDQFLRGDIFGFLLEAGEECDHGEVHWEHVDSCSGFYGHKLEDSGALEHIAPEHHALAREAFEKKGIES